MAVALVVAAGRGERLGSGEPKAFVLLSGRPMFEWSVEVLLAHPAIDQVIVALPPGDYEAPEGAIGVAGGLVRAASVRAALAAASKDADPILVHDAARPLLTSALIDAVLAGLDGVDAAIPAAPVSDTIKDVDGDGIVRRTLDRSTLWAVQTPQAFRRGVLDRALALDEEALALATDEASLVETLGGRVRIVASGAENLKVTTLLDLLLAEQLLLARA